MIELIAGGARSGKSSYALNAAERLQGAKLFVATATLNDDDPSMAARIAQHRRERSSQWEVREEPLALAEIVGNAQPQDVLLIDCLTLWLSNWLCGPHAAQWLEQKRRFIRALQETQATIFLVTNEVGMGVVPMGQLSRDFVDESGRLHQEIAAFADRVTLVLFGIATELKSDRSREG